MRLFQAGLPVPTGVTLTTSFFEPWLESLQSTRAWTALLATDGAALREICRHLQEIVSGYTLNSTQRQVLTDALRPWVAAQLFAVRSSSPEEDLLSSSFAGMYSTRLGVPLAAIASILPSLFAASLDHRIVSYKRHRRVDGSRPRLAVIVQEQVASDISGIGFSVNPLTGDRTQVVIESNWGLGSTVVSGTASPDHFVLDKATGTIIERRLGRKERSLLLKPGGGTREENDPRYKEWTLSETQLRSLLTLVLNVERLCGRPVDMEWAIARRQFSILQVRPVTSLDLDR